MIKHFIRITLTLVLLSLLIINVDVRHVGAILSTANPYWLALGAAINLLAVVCAAWRWQVLLIGLGIGQTFLRLVRIVLTSTFFGMFLPSSIGGDVMKMVLIAPGATHREAAITSVLMDRVVGMAVTIGVGLLAVLLLPSVWGNTAVILALGIATLVLCGGIYVLLSRALFRLLSRLTPPWIWGKVGASLTRAHESLLLLRHRPDALAGAACISLLRQVTICGSVFCAGMAFGVPAGPVAYFALIPISMAITTLPIAINGLGLQDGAMILLLGTVGITAAQALTLSLFLHAMRNAIGLLGGLLFVLARQRPLPTRESVGGVLGDGEAIP